MSTGSHPVSRLEGFSDAVFGFALTLLVVQLEAPRTGEALRALVRGSLPFALTFAMVCYLWWEHNRFFRLTGLQDAWTAFLNSTLLFVVLFYVYPLKYLATGLLGPLIEGAGGRGLADGRFVMIVYSAGVLAIFAIFTLLYSHAWSRRSTLELSGSGEITLRFKRRAHLFSAVLALISLALAVTLPDRWVWVAGVLYALMGPFHGWNGYRAGRTQAALSASG